MGRKLRDARVAGLALLLCVLLLTVVAVSLQSHWLKSRLRMQCSKLRNAPAASECAAHADAVRMQLWREHASAIDPGGTKGRVSCSVPCYPEKKKMHNWRVHDGNGRSLALRFTQEGPAHYPHLYRKDRGVDALAVPQRSRADVPVPYFSLEAHSIHKPAVTLANTTKGATFVARNCHSLNNREAGVRALQQYISVYSISSCMRNAKWPSGVDAKNKLGALRQFALTLAFENQNVNGHVTEKLWQALSSGTLPVYFGAPDVAQQVPANSIVHANMFDSWDALGQHLQHLLSNETAYKQYHKWREEALPKSFLRYHAYTLSSDDCRACKLLYARSHELQWNHELQEIDWPCCQCDEP